MLPPITIAYKRKYEDEEEEYDPEMDDFIDDGGEEQDEISRHIKEIFGYDRNRWVFSSWCLVLMGYCDKWVCTWYSHA